MGTRRSNEPKLRVECLLHWLLLAVYFALRFTVESLLLRLPFPVEISRDCDAVAYIFIGRLVGFIYFLKTVTWTAFSLVAQRPLLLASLSIAKYTYTGIQATQWLRRCYKLLALFWCIHRVVSSWRVREQDLWLVLERFISFTRISTGRVRRRAKRSSCAGRSFDIKGLLVTVAPLLVQTVFASLVLSYVVRVGRGCKMWNYNTNEQMTATALTKTGFTAMIPKCYDGDTCYTENLSFNGVPLPPLFQSMKIRLLGIDTPELSRASCKLERCLALQAKDEMEHIVQSGDGHIASLLDCKIDKYGGRIVCDIQTQTGERASNLILQTGLAVPYYGEKKSHPWCQVRKSQKEALKARIAMCLLQICPSYSDERGCSDAYS